VLYYSRLINSDNHRILDLRGKDLAGITKELWRKPPVRTTPGYLTPPQLDWANVKDQWNGLKGRRKLPYNLGLSPLGRVQISLTPFDHKGKSVRMNPGAVQQLHQMAGKAPMQLVVQSHTRILLQTAMDSDLWRVDPKLIEAVTAAVKDYESSRAPLIALNQVQSLGYLDEHATILCEKDFEPFEAGQRYRLQTELMECEVEKLITNSSGGQEQVVRRGQELVIKVSRDSHVVHFLYEHEGYFFSELKGKQGCFKLQTLLDHFHIPKVPSLTELRQDEYEENRRRVIAMAAMISARSSTW